MATEKVKVYEEKKPNKGGLPIWAWLLPLLLVLALAFWLLNRRHDTAESATAAAPAAVTDQTKPDAGAGASGAWTAATISNSIRSNGRVGFSDNDVHFATGSAALAGDSQAVLDQTAQALQQNADWHMRVVGHTDSVGSKTSNDQLGQQRATSVMNYLTAHGVAANRLSVDSKGQADPAATNQTDAGRAENRRVELIKQ